MNISRMAALQSRCQHIIHSARYLLIKQLRRQSIRIHRHLWGTKGFSLKPATVSKYYIGAEYRSACLKQLQEMIEVQCPKLSHAGLGKSRIKKDEEDVEAIGELVDLVGPIHLPNNHLIL